MTVLKLVNLLIPLVARVPAAEVKLSNTNVDWKTADIEKVYEFKNTIYIEVTNRELDSRRSHPLRSDRSHGMPHTKQLNKT